MFDGDFKELLGVFIRFGKALGEFLGTLIKTAIFWSFALLPAIVGFIITVLTTNILWVAVGVIIELGWACLLICSDDYKYYR